MFLCVWVRPSQQPAAGCTDDCTATQTEQSLLHPDGYMSRFCDVCVPCTQASPRCVSVLEINSETDFVGRSEPFQQLVKAAAAAAAALLPQPPAAMQVRQLDFDEVSSSAAGG